MTIADIIDLIHPGVDATGVILADQIWVIFDREIDENSLSIGNLFVEGPDTDSVIGPDFGVHLPNVSDSFSDDPFQSPNYRGLVDGDITFQRIELLTLDEYTGPDDTTGAGNLWRTKVIFTPRERLQKLSPYTVYLSGDEDIGDSLSTGIVTRTIFDVVDGVNTGDGTITPKGTYNGAITDTYNITITTTGPRETAKFTWFKSSAPLDIHGPIKTEEFQTTPLDKGVEIIWNTGTFDTGDTFSFVVVPATKFEGNMYWSFETGSGSIQAVPDTASTTVTGDVIDPDIVTSTSTFSVVSTTPVDMSTNLSNSLVTLTVKFSEDLAAVPPVTIIASPVIGDDDSNIVNITTDSNITFTTVAAGPLLTITLDPGQLFNNNLIQVTIDDTAQGAISGDTLFDDFIFWFTTTYNPLYSSVRRVRLEIGSFIANVSDDTINLAIFEASLLADTLSFAGINPSNKLYAFAKREWVTCKAAQMLLMNVLGTGGLKSKKLDNLEVTYDQNYGEDLLKKVGDCLARWEAQLVSLGAATQKPQHVVKGEFDIDSPNVGRMWEKGPYVSQDSAANLRYLPNGKRRYIAGYYRNWRRGSD